MKTVLRMNIETVQWSHHIAVEGVAAMVDTERDGYTPETVADLTIGPRGSYYDGKTSQHWSQRWRRWMR